MRSPSDMEFIQIDITNACNMRCSNCTRFCGNHAKNFFMDYETFVRAVDSLEGFDGVTGVIGGEPTLHPEFERFALYLREKFKIQRLEAGASVALNKLIYPQRNFIRSIHEKEFASNVLRERADGGRFMKKHGAGLWSNMGSSYVKYYELIQDTFQVQYLNDHINPSYHQPGLFSRLDLGVSDEEWIPMRDSCWVQNTWSATITPKGAFFCEIAGALDMLFGGPGGWKIEPGWWKRSPGDFGEQLNWCEICGFALEGRTFTRDSQEETDDVSPTDYELLKKTGGPKLKAGKINRVVIRGGIIAGESGAVGRKFNDRYIDRYEDRFHEKNSALFNMEINDVFIPDREGFGRGLNRVLAWEDKAEPVWKRDGWILLRTTGHTDTEHTGAGAADEGAERIESVESIGRIESTGFEKNPTDTGGSADTGGAFHLAHSALPDEMAGLVGRCVFNPGTLHLGAGFLFFSRGALSLRKIGYDGVAHLNSARELEAKWNPEKVVRLADTGDMTRLGRPSLHRGLKYAVWGAGPLGEFFTEMIEEAGGELAFVADKSPAKQGQHFAGGKTISPRELADRVNDFDKLLIGHHLKFEEIRREAMALGIPGGKIMLPYEV